MPNTGESYRLRFDDGPFGSGNRYIVILAVGRRWVRVVSPATLTTGKIASDDWRASQPVLLPIPAQKVARRIEKRARLFRRLGMAFPKKTIRRVIEQLRSAT